MLTLPATPRSRDRSQPDRSRTGPGRPTPAGPLSRASSEEGFLLIEVLISAVLVALIVVATFTGFDVVNRTSADQRQRNEAAVLAAQSQEQLRSDPASTLQLIGAHEYTQVVAGTTYKITQGAELQPGSGSSANCSVTETKRQSGNAYRITSKVTWSAQEKVGRPAVVASGLTTPPTGSGLEVDFDNATTVTAGVPGLTAIVKYTPVGSGSVVTLEQTAGSEGCVVFGAIPATSATVEVKEASGYVTISGAPKFPTKEVKIAPNYTTHYAVVYNRGGSITAKFAYKNTTEKYKHLSNDGKSEVEEQPVGDTFVAFNSLMAAKPDFEIGSTRYAAATETYNPLPGTFEASATSPSNLFPFTEGEKGKWNAYAGDCVANEPETVTAKAVKQPTTLVTPGGAPEVVVPTAYDTLNLYNATRKAVTEAGAKAWEKLEVTTPRSATITNSTCAASVAPNNESAINIKHVQETSTGAVNGGHLKDPFQPFGTEFQLCVYVSPRAYIRKFANTKESGEVLPIYLSQKSSQEKLEAKAAAEAAEATAKKKAEETEATERATWKAEEKAGKKTKVQREALEKTQKENREKRETKETTERKTAETTEKTTREAKEATEANTKKTRETNETAENKEDEEGKVTVETRGSCP